jgi:orotate phosphoribosyltransferase
MNGREELRKMIQERALQFGDFTLASGRKSNYIIDGKKITLNSRGARLLAEQILAILNPQVEAIGGMTLGADPIIGAMLSLADLQKRSLTGFIVRKQTKDHGTSQRVEGSMYKEITVAVLEDTITTGKTVLDTIQVLQHEFDVTIIQIIAMVDRLEGGRENLTAQGYPLTALFTKDELGINPTQIR